MLLFIDRDLLMLHREGREVDDTMQSVIIACPQSGQQGTDEKPPARGSVTVHNADSSLYAAESRMTSATTLRKAWMLSGLLRNASMPAARHSSRLVFDVSAITGV